MSALLPFPDSSYNQCDYCPRRGWKMIPQRAFIRSIDILFSIFPEHKRAEKKPSKFAIAGFILASITVYLFSIVLETIYQILSPLWSNPVRIIVYAFTLCALILPAVYLWKNPDQPFSPIAGILKDIILFLLTIIGTYFATTEVALKRANNKWVPQARSSCRGLLTLWGEVQRLRFQLANLCSTVTTELPEMQHDDFKGARTALKLQCSGNADRLDGIAEHLNDAVADWETFIGANCEGTECEQITSELAGHRVQIIEKLAAATPEIECKGKE